MGAALAAGLAAVVLVGTPEVRAAGGLSRFEQQRIAWHDCRTGPDDVAGTRLAAAGARCAEVTVPLDYADPGGRTISVAIARRAATDQAHRRGTLVINTGGPGPSRDGVVLVARGLPPEVPRGAPAVAAVYDLVGMDPRFFGLSTPLECGWPTEEYLRSAQRASVDRAEFDRSVAVAKDLAGRCANRRDVLPFGSTANMARDMDIVRAALGERKISYLGVSFGGHLGADYLQLFGAHADRVVLDSPAGPQAAGSGLTRETARADAAALRDWARWAALRDAQYHLGRTAHDVLAVVDRINRAAAREPLRVGTHRVDAAAIPGLLLTAEDSDAFYAAFSAQVSVLRDAARRLPVTPTPDLELKLALEENPNVIPEFGFSATIANQCTDRAAPRDPEFYWRDIRTHLAAEPLFGPLARHITPCAFWPVRPAEAPLVIGNDHPTMIVSATGDSATPYVGAQAMHRALSRSRLITLDNAFRHGVFLFDPSTCIDHAVQSYLLDGTLPSTDLTCTRAT